jgi:hypothetical protein
MAILQLDGENQCEKISVEQGLEVCFKGGRIIILASLVLQSMRPFTHFHSVLFCAGIQQVISS